MQKLAADATGPVDVSTAHAWLGHVTMVMRHSLLVKHSCRTAPSNSETSTRRQPAWQTHHGDEDVACENQLQLDALKQEALLEERLGTLDGQHLQAQDAAELAGFGILGRPYIQRHTGLRIQFMLNADALKQVAFLEQRLGMRDGQHLQARNAGVQGKIQMAQKER